jgi:hypothetical protein
MRSSRVIGAVAAILTSLVLGSFATAQSLWQQPAADLASQIAAILGHGTARLMIRNLSSLSVDEIPAIRKLLEQDLRTHGITANSAPSETVIRVTLSETARGRTWVAEVIQGDEVIHGNDTQVAIVDLPPGDISQAPAHSQFMLRRVALITVGEQVLDAVEISHALVLLTPKQIEIESRTAAGWAQSQSAPIPPRLPLARDPRGMLLPTADGAGFAAWLAGHLCTGSSSQASPAKFTLDCRNSDDPWPLNSSATPLTLAPSDPAPNPPPNPPPLVQDAPPVPPIRAFYNAARNYFTGVISPGMGVDLPPFYSATILDRTSGSALLINAIDGRALIAASGKLTVVKGTDDWGSDFALIQSGCGDGAQVIVSGADTSDGDSLRAYQITGSEATPSSAPLQIEGTVTAIQTAPDGKSVLAVIRNAQNQYEVDRVTALCD